MGRQAIHGNYVLFVLFLCCVCVLESVLAHAANLLIFSNSLFASSGRHLGRCGGCQAMAKHIAGWRLWCNSKQEAAAYHTASFLQFLAGRCGITEV